ncbi:MAG: hypothetical protein FJX53_16935 [Alphaproteobacteria bacterium]|nr:hypothetical protein [Alphaproteobacteria bacterium]
MALALAIALAVSWIGIVAVPALPPVDPRDWAAVFALTLPLPFLLLERRPRLGLVAPLAALAVVVMLRLYLAPLLGGASAPSDRVAQAGGLLLFVWLAVDRLAIFLPGPTILASLGATALGASIAVAMSGTPLLGQALGGVAAVVGLASLVTWRVPRLTVGRSAVAAVNVALFGGLIYAHFQGDLPAGPTVVALLGPFGALAALPLRAVVPATLLAAAVSAVPAGGAILWAKSLAEAKQTADVIADPVRVCRK